MSEFGEKIKSIIEVLPQKPGVYQFHDETGNVIYVGKAKSLRSRVRSYFNKQNFENGKTRLLVKKIRDIQYFVVESEYEALLLENNMIKKYQPRYNIQLKDDKTYPFICVKKERFPRVFSTRNLIRDGSDYFGPYASVRMMQTLLDLIRQLYKLRNCNFDLSPVNIQNNKFKVCLEYHVKNCLGPCEGLQTEADYNDSINEIKKILSGNIHEVISLLKGKMQSHSVNLDFENAEIIRKKLDILLNFKGKSTVVSPKISNLDVFSYADDEKSMFVNYMKVINGAIIQGHTLELKKKLNEEAVDLLLIAIAEFRQRFNSTSKEIVLPLKVSIEIPNVKITRPVRGDKLKLLELSSRNAKFFMMDRLKRLEKVNPEEYSERLLMGMQKDLRLPSKPVRIECFDNSNIQGSDAVAACVIFINGKPAKNEYRHFNIKSVEGPDDFASMREIIFRRYSRRIEEKADLPDLIIIDGGKGQLSAAMESIDKLNLRGKISVIGIAKKLEEIYFPGDSVPLYIDKRSETLKVIQHARNEAHRFGISHHRNKRSKRMLEGGLSEIPGIGKETEKNLLRKFKSVKRIKEAKKNELTEIIGIKRAGILIDYFEKEAASKS